MIVANRPLTRKRSREAREQADSHRNSTASTSSSTATTTTTPTPTPTSSSPSIEQQSNSHSRPSTNKRPRTLRRPPPGLAPIETLPRNARHTSRSTRSTVAEAAEAPVEMLMTSPMPYSVHSPGNTVTANIQYTPTFSPSVPDNFGHFGVAMTSSPSFMQPTTATTTATATTASSSHTTINSNTGTSMDLPTSTNDESKASNPQNPGVKSFWNRIPEHSKPRILSMLRSHPDHPWTKQLKSLLQKRQQQFSHAQEKEVQPDSTSTASTATTTSATTPAASTATSTATPTTTTQNSDPQRSWRTRVEIDQRRQMFDVLVRQIMLRPPFSQLPRSDRQSAVNNENLVRKFILEQVTDVWKMSDSEGEFLQHISTLPDRLIKLYRPE